MAERTKMQGINTILIDMYGVILEESKGYFIPYTYQHFPETEYERLTRQFRVEKLFTKAGVGELDSDTFLELLGFQDTQFHMKDYIENYLTLDAGFIPFAEKYSKKYNEAAKSEEAKTKFDIVLLSNDVSQWSTYITQYHGLNGYFSDKIVSADVGCRKPQKEIYELALKRIGKKAEECCFIDNSVSNLNVAAELGILPILFNRDKEEYNGIVVNTFEELAEFLERSA